MKNILIAAGWTSVLAIAPAFAQEPNLPPVRTSVVTTQRIGDLVVQSTVTPTWYIPNGVAVAVPAGQPNQSTPPTRQVAPAEPRAAQVDSQPQTPVVPPVVATPQMQSQITTVVVTQPGAGVTRETPETRKSSADWKQKVESLTGELESSKLAIIDAQAQMLVAAEEERRAAEEQVAAAQRRLEASKKQAERASAYAASLQPVQTSVVAAKPQEVVAPAAIASPATPAPVFTLRRQDRTIPAALTRWAEEAGYTLLWEAREDPASFEETYAKSFPDAVDDVIRDLRLAGRDVRMCEYRNKVVRIVPRAATCKIVPPAESAHVQLGATE